MLKVLFERESALRRENEERPRETKKKKSEAQEKREMRSQGNDSESSK